jgi:hypothetical protein
MNQKAAASLSTQLFEANVFDFSGPIHINYSRTSFTGQPLLSYQDAALDLQFQGDDITRTDTPAGELVTVTVQIVPDAFVRTMTLVVPTVRLAPASSSTSRPFSSRRPIDRARSSLPRGQRAFSRRIAFTSSAGTHSSSCPRRGGPARGPASPGAGPRHRPPGPRPACPLSGVMSPSVVKP